jgi:NAD(P)-dependent dehydrogenase (short-subunit alcohol dehydrogenase family)
MAASPRPVVLVTGAAKRLGREISLMLAAAGWNIAVHYRSSESEALATTDECGGKAGFAAAFQCHLDVETEARELIPRVAKHFGRIDAVVNSASQFEYDKVDTFGFAALESHLRTNVGAAVLLARSLHAHVEAAGGTGVVVNLLDQKLWNMNPDFFSYTLSKAALEAANTMLALALAPQVRVVGVAPGLTSTNPLLDSERFEQLHRLSPLGHSSTPHDIAHAVKFAMENSSITGTTLMVDGGQHLMRSKRDFAFM